MRIPLSLRAASACALATLLLSLSSAPSFARMGGSAGGSFAHSSFGMGHAPHFASHGFNQRFETGRFGFNRFGPNRFDRFGFNRFGFNRFNRFGFDRFGRNPLFLGAGWDWGGWGGYAAPTGSQPIIVGDSAPVIINISLDPAAGDAAGTSGGGCVIHKLNYDSNGKYVGERQIPC